MTCYDGFGNFIDGQHQVWIGNFKADKTDQVLFFYEGDKNWWISSSIAQTQQLQFSPAGNTAGFGDAPGGCPVWIGNFSRADRSEVLFHYPGDGSWWLGTHDGVELKWRPAGDTNGFGQIWDGRPFWTGSFSRPDRTEVLFYRPEDGNWWLGAHDGQQLNWSFAGNTGKPLPHRCRVRVHIKVLTKLSPGFLDSQVDGMRDVFDKASVHVELGSIEDLTGVSGLASLEDINVDDCQFNIWPWPSTTADQNAIFRNRNFAGPKDVVVYFVRSIIGNAPKGSVFGGCATYPIGRPGCIVARSNKRWVTAHEVGHVLGLGHVGNTDQIMWETDAWTKAPPELDQGEADWINESDLTVTC